MKLATLKDGSRDGMLAVVSRDMTRAHFAVGIASTLQQVLDDWNFRAPQLEDLYASLNGGKLRHAFAFDARHCMAPLPRAFCWVQGGAERQEGAPPSMTRGSSDDFFGPCDEVPLANADDGFGCDAGVAVVTSDVPQGCSESAALEALRLFMLSGRWTLRRHSVDEQRRGAAPLHSHPATSFSPVAVTADELGAAWRGGWLQLPLHCRGAVSVQGDGQTHHDGPEELATAWHFGQLVAHLALTRRLRAGSVVGRFGAWVATQDGAAAPPRGAEAPPRAALRCGERVHIEMIDPTGQSLFGAIDQAAGAPAAADLIEDLNGADTPVKRRALVSPLAESS